MGPTETPYRVKIDPKYRRGKLHVGWKSFPVDVEAISRSHFSLLVPNKIARRLTIGRKAKMRYDGIDWSVVCSSKVLGEEGLGKGVVIELEKVAELTTPKLEKRPRSSTCSVRLKASDQDPVLPIALLTAFMVFLVILPRAGKPWGLLDGVAQGSTGSWQSLISLSNIRR